MKNRIISVGLTGILTVMAGLDLWAGEPEYVAEVTVNKLFARTGPATNYTDINVLRKGEMLVVLEEKSGWLKIQLPADTACWVHKKWVEVKENNAGVVKGKNVNVRVAPDTSGSGNIIGDLDENAEVTITGEKNDWYKIAVHPSLSAWVSKKHTKYAMKYKDYQEWQAKAKEEQDAQAKKEAELKSNFEMAEQICGSIDFPSLDFKNDKQVKETEGLLNHARALYAEVAEYAADEEMKSAAGKRLERLNQTIELYAQTVKLVREETKTIAEIRKKFNEEMAKIAEGLNPPKKQYLAQGFVDFVGKYAGRPGTHKLVKGGETLVYLKSNSEDINLDDYYKKYVGIDGDLLEVKDVPEKVIVVKAIVVIK